MPRQNVQDSDVQQFRHRLEHFERRQSDDMVAYEKSRKRRSSQCWQDVQLEQMQFTENWRDDVCFKNHHRPRSLEPPRAVKEIARPTPVLPASPRKRSRKNTTPPAPIQQRQMMATRYIEPAGQPLWLPVVMDPVLPSIEYETFDVPPATFSRASSSAWESEPRTPENSFQQTAIGGVEPSEFHDMNIPATHSGLMATNLSTHDTFNPVEMGTMGVTGGVGYDKGGYAGADFERAFEEFMNVS